MPLILEVRGSIIDPETAILTEFFGSFCQFLQSNVGRECYEILITELINFLYEGAGNGCLYFYTRGYENAL